MLIDEIYSEIKAENVNKGDTGSSPAVNRQIASEDMVQMNEVKKKIIKKKFAKRHT